MKKYQIVKKNNDFNDIINTGAYFKNKYYYIYYKDKGLKIPRFGLAVSKSLGNAVVRNYIKRQLRCIIDENLELFLNYDYIIVVRKRFLELSYKEKMESLIVLMKERKV